MVWRGGGAYFRRRAFVARMVLVEGKRTPTVGFSLALRHLVCRDFRALSSACVWHCPEIFSAFRIAFLYPARTFAQGVEKLFWRTKNRPADHFRYYFAIGCFQSVFPQSAL